MFENDKKALLEIGEALSGQLDEQGALITAASAQQFETWRTVCHKVRRNVQEDVLRVAVIGAIKSGKSTLVNAIVGDDYLKRGAGVITSIVTKVQQGEHLQAELTFKTWDEINADIQQAIILLPGLGMSEHGDGFDLRNPDHRDALSMSLNGLDPELLITSDTRNLNTVLLEAYLAGFDRVKDIITGEPVEKIFSGDTFAVHQSFVADESLSVFLRDLRLRIPDTQLPDALELADCQGSDSPNPMHLAMIQDYLMTAHLTIYVISSRTGVRQADIRFLKLIHRMGIAGNMRFIFNCDISEHEGLSDLLQLEQRALSEIGMIIPSPEMFTVSALLSLFRSRESRLQEKDRNRLSHWEAEADIIDHLQRQTRIFENWFYRKVADERAELLVKNNIERLAVVNGEVSQWARVRSGLLKKDVAAATEIAQRIAVHQSRMNEVIATIRNTLAGAVSQIRRRLRSDVDRFFDIHHGEVTALVLQHVRNYTAPVDAYSESMKSTAFMGTLYQIFVAFKQSTDNVMAESVTPEVVRFIREKEQEIAGAVYEAVRPYLHLVWDTLTEYQQTMAGFDIVLPEAGAHDLQAPSITRTRESRNLMLPAAVAVMRYSAHIKTDAIIRFGIYKAIRILRQVFKRSTRPESLETIHALRDGVVRMKKETERSIIAYFKDYRENIKFQYLFKLMDAYAADLQDLVAERFTDFGADLTEMISAAQNRRLDREQAVAALEHLQERSDAIRQRIDRLRQAPAENTPAV